MTKNIVMNLCCFWPSASTFTPIILNIIFALELSALFIHCIGVISPFYSLQGNTVAMLVQGSLLFIYFIVTVIRFISIIYKYPLNKWLSLLLL